MVSHIQAAPGTLSKLAELPDVTFREMVVGCRQKPGPLAGWISGREAKAGRLDSYLHDGVSPSGQGHQENLSEKVGAGKPLYIMQTNQGEKSPISFTNQQIDELARFLDKMGPGALSMALHSLRPEYVAQLAISAYRASAEEVEFALQAGEQALSFTAGD